MKSAAVRGYTLSVEVIFFEDGCLPFTTGSRCQIIVDNFVEVDTDDVNMSTVRSVSGFAVDVLKFGPL